MDDLQIILPQKSYQPGERLKGRVNWNLGNQPKTMEIRLFWYTRGKGTEDATVFETLPIEASHLLGEKEFELTLPVGPYSFSGQMISLIWALEFVVEPGKACRREEIVISPTGQEVDITQQGGSI